MRNFTKINNELCRKTFKIFLTDPFLENKDYRILCMTE